jgi:hypothetical protein
MAGNGVRRHQRGHRRREGGGSGLSERIGTFTACPLRRVAERTGSFRSGMSCTDRGGSTDPRNALFPRPRAGGPSSGRHCRRVAVSGASRPRTMGDSIAVRESIRYGHAHRTGKRGKGGWEGSKWNAGCAEVWAPGGPARRPSQRVGKPRERAPGEGEIGTRRRTARGQLRPPTPRRGMGGLEPLARSGGRQVGFRRMRENGKAPEPHGRGPQVDSGKVPQSNGGEALVR